MPPHLQVNKKWTLCKIIIAILKFLYCEDIELDYPLAIQLLEFADKYSLQSLNQVCDNYLAQTVAKNNIDELNQIAKDFKAVMLENAILDFKQNTSSLETLNVLT